MITFRELISLKTDILESSNVKYVRHKDNRKEYRDLIKDRDELLEYQRDQKNDIFNGCDYIVSFFGQESTKALFIGVFKVNGVRKENDEHYYDLKEVKGFDDFKDRVVIDWGKATLSWHQWYNKTEKEVVEILPKGYLGEPSKNIRYDIFTNVNPMLQHLSEKYKLGRLVNIDFNSYFAEGIIKN